jgi:hypothetical protein
VFTSEMSEIFVALIQIRARHPGRYLIVTDSMSSVEALQPRRVPPRTHSLVCEIKEACWWLKNIEYEIHMMWIPSYEGVSGSERAYQLTSGMHLFVLLMFSLCLGQGCWKTGRVAGMVGLAGI